MLGLIGIAFVKQLHWAQWAVIGIYLVYLSPYIAVSYYDRYAAPLLAVKVLLVLWVIDHVLALLPVFSRCSYGRTRACFTRSRDQNGSRLMSHTAISMTLTAQIGEESKSTIPLPPKTA